MLQRTLYSASARETAKDDIRWRLRVPAGACSAPLVENGYRECLGAFRKTESKIATFPASAYLLQESASMATVSYGSQNKASLRGRGAGSASVGMLAAFVAAPVQS